MTESRTFVLQPEVVERLCQTKLERMPLKEGELEQLLPAGLSPDEIDDVGIQIQNAAERIQPSRDGCSRGQKVEATALLQIGAAAALDSDFTTTESVLTHFKKGRLGFTEDFAGYLALRPLYRKMRRQALD